MPARLKLVVAYDGAAFAGWQSQPDGNTIQDHLEEAFAAIVGQRVRVHGAGRTDAGVHALAQVAHVDLPVRTLRPERWPHAVNTSLPPTIRVLRCRYVPQSFHARFSARGKVYRYRIWNDRILPPFDLNRAWHVVAPLDFEVISTTAQLFKGRHDFAGFAANRGKPEQDTVRTIDAVSTRRRGRLIVVEFSGDGFLYKMVRLMAGALVDCGLGRCSRAEIRSRLQRRAEPVATTRFAAPATGLFLVRVRY